MDDARLKLAICIQHDDSQNARESIAQDFRPPGGPSFCQQEEKSAIERKKSRKRKSFEEKGRACLNDMQATLQGTLFHSEGVMIVHVV